MAIELFQDMGKFAQCAKLEKDIAAIYEAEMALEPAIEHYSKAAELYSMEEQQSCVALHAAWVRVSLSVFVCTCIVWRWTAI